MTMTDEVKTSWARTLLGWGFLLFGVFAFQTVAAKPFYIPSSSMMPALLEGDRLVVSKYPYGWSRASLTIHGSEIAPGRILGRNPERGDIVTVVRRGDGEDLIKRVIGLPGDTIEVRDGLLAINGVEVPRVAMGSARLRVDANVTCDDPRLARFRRLEDGVLWCAIPMFRETLPNGATYDTLDLGRHASPADDYGPRVVPEGHVFLMGDNRDMSADSRYPLDQLGLGGPVPLETISGRAEFITYSLDGSGKWIDPGTWLYAVRGARTATSLRPEKAATPTAR
jgi:signal peptidase I